MKRKLVYFLLVCLFIGCASKEEGAIADYIQRKDNVKTDLGFKTISSKELGNITAKDSLDILEKELAENRKLDLENLYKKKENDEYRLSEEKRFARNNQPYHDQMTKKYWEDAIKEKENILSETERLIKLYETDCIGTRLEPVVYQIQKYKELGEKLLAVRVECTYSIINPLLNNVRQEITETFILTPNLEKVITVEK